VDEPTWKPRRGAPGALPGETREQYAKRIRSERNRRHRASVKAREWAASPAGKVAAAAAAAAKPGERRDRFEFQATRAEVASAASARRGLSRERWLQLEREPAYVPASVVTNQGRSSFDPADPADIARVEGLLRSEPGLEDLDPDALRAALAQVKPGETFSLADEQPHAPK
jgi:hypothetical protein